MGFPQLDLWDLLLHIRIQGWLVLQLQMGTNFFTAMLEILQTLRFLGWCFGSILCWSLVGISQSGLLSTIAGTVLMFFKHIF